MVNFVVSSFDKSITINLLVVTVNLTIKFAAEFVVSIFHFSKSLSD